LRNWIGELHEHHWHGVCGLPDRRQADCGSGENDVRHQPDQLRRVNPREFGIAGIPTKVDLEILTFDPSQLLDLIIGLSGEVAVSRSATVNVTCEPPKELD
jgi:hypothetical protein